MPSHLKPLEYHNFWSKFILQLHTYVYIHGLHWPFQLVNSLTTAGLAKINILHMLILNFPLTWFMNAIPLSNTFSVGTLKHWATLPTPSTMPSGCIYLTCIFIGPTPSRSSRNYTPSFACSYPTKVGTFLLGSSLQKHA